jgi:NADH-ubiquinone oxidoreductase chain 5
MAIPFVLLGLGSIFIGYLTKDMLIGAGTNFWNNALFVSPQNMILFDSEFLPAWIKLIPVLFSLFGASLAFVLYHFYPRLLLSTKESSIGRQLYKFLNKKWYFDEIYNALFIFPILSFGYRITFRLIDRGIIEIFGPYGIASTIRELTSKTSQIQTGFVYHYAFLMLIAVTIFIAFAALWNLFFTWIDYRFYFIYFVMMLLYHTSLSTANR